MLLRNSTSITWISVTAKDETSAHVLFVYVLSSRTASELAVTETLNQGHRGRAYICCRA